MAIRISEAEWRGDLKGGKGEIKLGSGAWAYDTCLALDLAPRLWTAAAAEFCRPG